MPAVVTLYLPGGTAGMLLALSCLPQLAELHLHNAQMSQEDWCMLRLLTNLKTLNLETCYCASEVGAHITMRSGSCQWLLPVRVCTL